MEEEKPPALAGYTSRSRHNIAECCKHACRRARKEGAVAKSLSEAIQPAQHSQRQWLGKAETQILKIPHVCHSWMLEYLPLAAEASMTNQNM